MTREAYEKPTMKVVELQHKTTLLAGSGVGATNTIKEWDNGGTTTEDIYM